MAFRYIVVNQKAHLKLKNNNLVIAQENNQTSVPVEDILSLIIEDNSITLTSQLMRKLILSNATVYFCDDKHIPCGITMPFLAHGRQYKRLNQQIDISQPLKKRIWQQIIKQKIVNQAKCLKLCNISNYEGLLDLANRVESGDTTNVEGYAAHMYFPLLFGKSFNRDQINNINAALNYGYTIMRGVVARAIAGYGFIPCLGINHHNEYNNFNLADDLIEPFRPVIDLWVKNNIKEDTELSSDLKHQIVNIMNCNIKIDRKNFTISRAIEESVKSLVSVITEKSIQLLKVPELINLVEHSYE